MASRVRLRAVDVADVSAAASADQRPGLVVAAAAWDARNQDSWLQRRPSMPVLGSRGAATLDEITRSLRPGERTRVLVRSRDAGLVLGAGAVPGPLLGPGGPGKENAEAEFSDTVAAVAGMAHHLPSVPVSAIFGAAHRSGGGSAASASPTLPGRGLPLLESARAGVAAGPAGRLSPAARTIHDAAASGDATALRASLGLGADSGSGSVAASLGSAARSHHPENGATPLHVFAASMAGEDGAEAAAGVDALLAAGADVDARAGNGSTALHWAAGADAAGMVRVLLDRGADPLAVTYTWQRQIFGKGSGRTALHWAAERGSDECCALLEAAAGGAAAGVADERGVLPSEAAAGEGHAALGRRLQELEGARFVCIEVEVLEQTASAGRATG